jgi:hypothetical protein
MSDFVSMSHQEWLMDVLAISCKDIIIVVLFVGHIAQSCFVYACYNMNIISCYMYFVQNG